MSNYQPHILGKAAEQAVCQHLSQHGLQLVESNYQCRFGEIDLIMNDKNILVFIEVRMRKHHSHSSGLESVDFFKQKKIINTATFYLQQKRLLNKSTCRFDVVGVKQCQGKFEFEWIKQAFEAY